MNINSLIEKVKQDIYDSFGDITAEIDQKLDEVIETPGYFEGNPNDIVDTGRLRDSKEVDAQKDKVTFTYEPKNPDNGYPYAPAVWAGFYAYGGSKYIEGRHWTERAVKEVDPAERLAELMEEKGYSAEVKFNNIDALPD